MTKAYEQRKAANERYLAKLDDIRFRVPAGQRATIQQAARDAGQSTNAYIAQAVAERMQRDGFEPSTVEPSAVEPGNDDA